MSTPIITSQTTIAEITNLLSQCGCPDITYRLDLPRCSQWRVNGGGQGDIHEGTLVDGARVAIKVSRGDQSIDISKGDKSFKRVARELYTWFTLSHPNIAELLGMAVFQGGISMISPWITPGDFYKFINAFPEADRMDLCLQVANGLAYLHKNKVIFGDLKAQNILIGSDGIAKLTDFGLSILEKSHILFSTTSTTGGGSARWMAPELIEGRRERSFAADVYALAMTFIEILTGNVPFPDISDDTRVMFEVFYNKIVPSCPERLQVKNLRHREWWRLLTQCWCQQPEMRPQAVDWGLLDQTVTARRTEYLSEWLEYALRYGRTKSGSFEVLDTGVHMFFPNSTTTTFFVPEHVKGSGSESKEAALQALISQYTSATSDTRQPNLDATYVNTLQDSIDKDLKQRIHQVRHWIAINVARFPRDQNIHNIFASLDARALEMKAAARICSTKCSDCTQLCLRVYGHVNSEHKCPGHISTPVHRILPKSSSFYRQMATEDAARCIRVQDLDHMLISGRFRGAETSDETGSGFRLLSVSKR